MWFLRVSRTICILLCILPFTSRIFFKNSYLSENRVQIELVNSELFPLPAASMTSGWISHKSFWLQNSQLNFISLIESLWFRVYTLELFSGDQWELEERKWSLLLLTSSSCSEPTSCSSTSLSMVSVDDTMEL